MAIRWYISFKDFQGTLCTFNVLDSDYTGAATEVLGGGTPLKIRQLGQDDEKYTNIKATEAVAEFQSTSNLQYVDVFAYANKRFSAALIKNEETVWQGWAAPEYYIEPFIPVPYITSLRFTDGLVELKNKQFTPEDNDLTTVKKTGISYFARALAVIGHELPIDTAIDIDFTSDGITYTSRVMERLKFDWRVFRNEDGTYWTWYEVIDELLKTLQAKLYQDGGRWVIERVDQKFEDYRVERYDKDGIYLNTVSDRDDVISLTSNSVANCIRFVRTPAQMEISPAMKEFTIYQDYGRRGNILNFLNFDGKFYDNEFGAGILRHWTKSGDVTYEHNTENDALHFDTITGVSAFTNNLTSDIIDFDDLTENLASLMEKWFNGNIQMEFKARFKMNVSGDLTKLTKFKARIRLVLNFSGTLYTYSYQPDELLSNYNPPVVVNEGWISSYGATDYISTEIIQKKALTDWHEVKIVMPPPADEYGVEQTYIKAHVIIYHPTVQASDTTGFADGDGVLINNIALRFAATEKVWGADGWEVVESGDAPEREETYTIDDDNLLTPPDYKVKFGETPELYASKVGQGGGMELMNKYVVYDAYGLPVNYFAEHGETPEDGWIFTVNKMNLQRYYQVAKMKLSGQIYDMTDTLSFRSVLKDYSNRLYLPLNLSWDVRRNLWDGRWLSVYGPIALLAEDGEILLTEDGGELYAE